MLPAAQTIKNPPKNKTAHRGLVAGVSGGITKRYAIAGQRRRGVCSKMSRGMRKIAQTDEGGKNRSPLLVAEKSATKHPLKIEHI